MGIRHEKMVTEGRQKGKQNYVKVSKRIRETKHLNVKLAFEPLFQRIYHRLTKTSLTTRRKFLANDASEAPTTYNKRENTHPTTNRKILYEHKWAQNDAIPPQDPC